MSNQTLKTNYTKKKQNKRVKYDVCYIKKRFKLLFH